MTYLLRLVACLFVLLSFNAKAIHSDIWITLVDNQIVADPYDIETGTPTKVDINTGKYLYTASFNDLGSGPQGTSDPGFQSLTNTYNANDFLYYRAVGSLWFWNSQAWVNEVADQERVRIRDTLYLSSYVTEDGVSNPLGAIDRINGIGSVHQHINFFIENPGSGGPAVGAYMIDMELFVTDTVGGTTETHLSSDPFRVAFNYQMSELDFNYAIESLTQVPLPAGIYLFLSGLAGLGLMRGRNA